jgi:CopG family nickel-responsive transcriptional regulator
MKINNMAVISISITGELLRRLDEYIAEQGYSSRSEAIREAIREHLSDYELLKFEKGRIIATITVTREMDGNVDERLFHLHHKYDDIVTGNMHVHIKNRYCLEVFIAEGELEKVQSFIGKIRAIRGIQEVKYTVMPLPEGKE